MGLKAFVKVGNITNLSDARYCAGMGVELLGFNINPESEDYVNPETFHAIKGWIEGVRYVLEFDGAELPDYSEYDFDFLEVSDPAMIDLLNVDSDKVILRIDGNNNNLDVILERFKDKVSYFDFFSDSDTINQNVQSSLNEFPSFIGYGFSQSNINDLLDRFPRAGISLKGTKEIKPGYKDYDELADILEEIEEDF